MLQLKHDHSRPRLKTGHPLSGKKVYIPVMAEGLSEAVAAIFHWLGVEASATAPSNKRTLELGAKFTSGDECYPAKVTLGDLLRVIEEPGFEPNRSVFLLPTSDGPCRFGQYVPFLKKTLREMGYAGIEILSPASRDGYEGFGEIAGPFVRTAWRTVVATDTLRRALLKTRPYEQVPGAADRAFEASLADLCSTIESSCAKTTCQLKALAACLTRARDRFRAVPAYYNPETPLIGVVGEIFCRLNGFSNENLIRRLERHGAEVSLSQVSEWVAYANGEQARHLQLMGRAFSLEMLGAKLRSHVQHADRQLLIAPFHDDFEGYAEPDIDEILKLAEPYLPASGALGEMVVSVGTAAYLARHGADGVIDISPFTCMNGIVSEAIYPRLSADLGGIPIRNFYFDGTQSDLDRDLGIYLELTRSYRERKAYPRAYPAAYFARPSGAGTAPQKGSGNTAGMRRESGGNWAGLDATLRPPEDADGTGHPAV